MNMVDDLHRANMLHVVWTAYWLVGTYFSKPWSTEPPEQQRVSMGCRALTGTGAVKPAVRAAALAATPQVGSSRYIALWLYTGCC